MSQSAAEAAEARRCCIVARLTVSRPFNVNVDAQRDGITAAPNVVVFSGSRVL